MSAEELNKYLSYVRNLGFEDTPDYDYLRDLFTQALKNTGEVEDGEYDWMKLNNGKGWELSKHSSHHSHLAAAHASNRDLHSVPVGSRTGQRVPQERLNAAQPPVPQSSGTAKVLGAPQGQSRTRPGDGRGVSGVGRKPSANAAGLNSTDIATPAASTQAQFQNSNPNLGPRPNPPQMPMAAQNMTTVTTGISAGHDANGHDQQKPQQGGGKIWKLLCCGR